MTIKNFNNRGFSIIEVILAGTVFSLIVTALVGAFIYGRESTMLSGARTRATSLAEEGLEAVRNIRDENFTNLTDGTYGLAVSGGQWTLIGAPDIVDGFTREIIISTADASTKSIIVNVTWQQNQQRNGLIALMSYFTNWNHAGGPVTTNTFRVTEYYIGNPGISGGAHTLTLNQDLADNYFVIIEGAEGQDSNKGNFGPHENYVRLAADPNGTGDLNTSGASNQIRLVRGDSIFCTGPGCTYWKGVVTVVESLGDETSSGFRLLDVQIVDHSSTDIGGMDVSAVNWTDINQAMLIGGFNGSGCSTMEQQVANTKTCHVRIWPQGSNTINWSRSSIGASLSGANSTVMVLEWGSEWIVQRANVTGSAGGGGADATSEYNTAAINPVSRNNTWIWGTGHTDAAGVGDGAEGTLITLGDGVNQIITESTVAVGQEYSVNKSFEVYILTHVDLITDYRFKSDGNRNSLTYDIDIDPAGVQRMSLIYNGSDKTDYSYPIPIWSARYNADNLVRLERRRSGTNWPAWVQGIDISNILYTP